MYLAGVGVAHGDPDRTPLHVGNHLLGGNGLVSLLSEKLRGELGLTYSVSSRFTPMGAPGPFRIGLQTRADQVDEALQAVDEVLDGFLRRPLDPEQVARTKQNLRRWASSEPGKRAGSCRQRRSKPVPPNAPMGNGKTYEKIS